MIRIVFIWLDAMLSTGQLRGHGAKVVFFSRAYEGGVFPSFEASDETSPNGRFAHKATWTVIVSTLRAQADIVQCPRSTLEC
jgi:hypothetical protein